MDLADFMAAKLGQTTYRAMERDTGIARGTLEAIVKRQIGMPTIETLTRIAQAFGEPLWKVMHMAGVNLDLPQDRTEAGERMAALVARVPSLAHVVTRLESRYDTDPDFVMGILIGLEASLGQPDAAPE